MAWRILWIALIVVLTATISGAEKVMRPKLSVKELWSNDDYIEHQVVMDVNDPHINITVNLLKELKEVDIHMEGSIIRKTDSNYGFSFNTTMNLCTILNIKKRSPFGAAIVMLFKEYGNLPDKCPILPGKYGLRKFWIPETSVSTLLPGFDFELQLHAYKVDPGKERELIVKDHFRGETFIMDVDKIKSRYLKIFG